MASPGEHSNAEERNSSAREQLLGSQAESTYRAAYERLSAAFRTATARVEPGEVPPEAPPEAKELAQNTLIAVLFGIMYGGGKQYLGDRAAGIPTAPAGLPSKLHEARYVADIQTNRLLGQLRASIRGGVTIGGLAAVFYTTQILSSIARARKDHRDVMAAGLATGAAAGLFMPGRPGARLQSAVLGASIGCLAGFPIGLIQEKLADVPKEETLGQTQPWETADSGGSAAPLANGHPPAQGQRSYDSTAAVIAQMEASLQKNRSQR